MIMYSVVMPTVHAGNYHQFLPKSRNTILFVPVMTGLVMGLKKATLSMYNKS